MRPRTLLLSALLLATGSVAAAARPLLPLPMLALQTRPGSIYDAGHGPLGLIADKTARRPGDLVTVVIDEVQDISNEEKTDLKKDSSLDYALNSFNVFPNAFDPLPDISATRSEDLVGESTQEKSGSFTARVTAMVVDALPNGNLVIQGRREIRVDDEVKLIEFSGVVRRYDVTAANTVQSELVADARVTYVGHGPITRNGQRRGFGAAFHDFLDWLWPF
ncbi:MAG TPA: flagellar basal body L-ring protein FlgH [Planctomycetota bacterium]|nr:flagellar basal body L-ring protein FlgH [Planctomycetota bacterium]